jgi:hypothetical protein
VTSHSRTISTPIACAPFAIQTGRDLARLVVRHPSHIDAVLLLQRHVLPELIDVGLLRQQEQVAVLVEIDRRADNRLEVLHQGDRLDRQLDVGGVGELMSEATGILAGRPRCQLPLALEEDDVGKAASGEVPGDAASHAAAAGNDHISRVFHAYGSILRYKGWYR